VIAGASRLAERVEVATGIRLRSDQLGALPDIVRRAIGSAELVVALDRLDAEGPEGPLLQRIVDEVTVPETSFAREQAQLDTIEWARLAEQAAARGRRELRIWSAACSTGEETFTLALQAAEALGDSGFEVSVLGTDISMRALAQARAAEYGPRTLRRLAPELLERHFAAVRGGFVVRDGIRAQVRFERHNLARATAPPGGGSFDLVVCRNVLIYFAPEAVAHALGLLTEALAPGGQLLLGIADRLCVPARPPGKRVRATARATPRPRVRRVAARRAPAPATVPTAVVEAPRTSARPLLAEALQHADAGRVDEALGGVAAVLERDPMDAEAHFVRGLLHRSRDDLHAAESALRAACYADPGFGVAAFELARVHEALGDRAAARQAYERALEALEAHDDEHLLLWDPADAAGVREACRHRLRAL